MLFAMVIRMARLVLCWFPAKLCEVPFTVLLEWARSSMRAQDLEGAVRRYHLAAQLCPQRTAGLVRWELAKAYLQLQQPQQALEQLEKAHSLFPATFWRAAVKCQESLVRLSMLADDRDADAGMWEKEMDQLTEHTTSIRDSAATADEQARCLELQLEYGSVLLKQGQYGSAKSAIEATVFWAQAYAQIDRHLLYRSLLRYADFFMHMQDGRAATAQLRCARTRGRMVLSTGMLFQPLNLLMSHGSGDHKAYEIDRA